MFVSSMKNGLARSLVIILMASALPNAASAYPELNSPAPAFSLMDMNGDEVSLSDFAGQKIVLEWTNHDCPYVRKHYQSGNMQRTQRAVTEAGGVWLSIISSAPGTQGYVSAAEAQALTATRGVYATTVLFDPTGEVGHLYDARTTPQMVLIDEAGHVRYQGAIDDKPSARPSSLEGAKNYLLAAWKDLASGRDVGEQQTKPYGCSVKYK